MKGILPLLGRRVRLKCLRDTTVGLFPEAKLASFLLHVDTAHKDFFDSLSVEVARSARVRYAVGECFEFALWGALKDAARMQRIEALLRDLPGSAKRGAAHAFGYNWALASIVDLDSAGALTSKTLAAEAALWQDIPRFRLRLTAPTRIRLPASKAKGRARFVSHERELTDAVLNHALLNALVQHKIAANLSTWTIPAFNLHILSRELFWVNPSHRGDGDKPLDEGLMGEVVVTWSAPPSLMQWEHLVLLQYLGIGQARALGLGRMQLEQLGGEHSKIMSNAPLDGLARAGEERNLVLAHDHIASNADLREWPDADDAEWQQEHSADQARVHADLDTLARRLCDAAVDPRPLHPVQIPKPDGGARELLIPSFFDRVGQRAVLQTLEPALETLFSESSFGFRRGRGREAARDQILSLQRQGFGIVAETDIRRFFDDVAWWRIETRLRCLFGLDPVVNQIMRWVETPRSDGLPRAQGLPQGSALSPILSNLMLDHLDHALAALPVRAIRFADDLVILAKTTAQAENALAVCAETLAAQGLSLKLEKTQFTDFKRGFRFLGYQFVGGLAVQCKSTPTATAELPEPLREQLSPPTETSIDFNSIASGGAEPGTLLVISEVGARLRLAQGQLLVVQKDGRETRQRFGELSSILLLSRTQLSSEVIKAAMRANVAIHFLTDGNRWVGSTTGEPDGSTLLFWELQAARHREPNFALNCACTLVHARLHSMATMLRHRRSGAAVIDALQSLADSALRANSLKALLGIEGQSTKRYFAALAQLLPLGFPFTARTRRPPQDPVNALLSFGYTLLYQAAHSVLVAAGFNPRVGFYHQPRGTRAALASDFIEPYRFIVERQVLSQLNRREFQLSDFHARGDGACLLTGPARRRFVLGLHQRLQQPLRGMQDQLSVSIWTHFDTQARALRSAIVDADAPFKVTLFR